MRVTSYRKFQVKQLSHKVRCLLIAISASSVSVFRPGSTSPSAILFDAWENFNNRSPKADENIRSIKLDLAAAVDEVIDAAGQEWEPAWQRKLLSVRAFC
jgi:vacuolar protein sorting-associated protein 16